MALFAERLSRIDTENAFKIGPHISYLESKGNKVIKLNLGEPDFNIPDVIKDEIKNQLDKNNTHYCDPQGILTLRKAIAAQLAETRRIKAEPERVVVFPGAKPPIGLSLETYVNEGDEVIYPSPGFPIYESFIKYINAKPIPLHLKEEQNFSFTARELEPLITNKTKLIIVNFPSNPTGGVALREQLEEIAEVITKKATSDVRIYSDEVYEYITFDGTRHFSIASLNGMDKKTIIVSGHSKSFAWTGGRIGYALFPTVEEALIFKNLNINYFSCVSPYTQEGARAILEHKDRDSIVSRMVKTFEERRDFVVAEINKIDGIKCQNPKGAFYLFPNVSGICKRLNIFDLYNGLDSDIRSKTSPSTLLMMFLLYKYNVATMDRRSFGKIGSENEHYLRISIAADIESLKEGVKRIHCASSDTMGFKRFVEDGENLY